MTVNDDNARAAELLADIDPELAARLRARANVGRPANDAERRRQSRVRAWIVEELKRRPRKEVLEEAVRKHGGSAEFWGNIVKGKGRPPGYFD